MFSLALDKQEPTSFHVLSVSKRSKITTCSPEQNDFFARPQRKALVIQQFPFFVSFMDQRSENENNIFSEHFFCSVQ